MVRQVLAIGAVVVALQVAPPASTSPAVDAAFAKYWATRSSGDAAKVADEIVKSGASFDEALSRLRHGRSYAKTPPTGAIRARHGRFEYWLNVPAGYDSSRQYQVRIQLHGGVMRPEAGLRGDGAVRLPGVEQIYVSPSGWSESKTSAGSSTASSGPTTSTRTASSSPASRTVEPGRITSRSATRRRMRRSCR